MATWISHFRSAFSRTERRHAWEGPAENATYSKQALPRSKGLSSGLGLTSRLPASPSQILAPVVIIALLILALPRIGFAQVLYGSLTGNVTDQTGAVIPGAKVDALNVGTNISKTAVTDERGVYTLTDLLPGVYKVTVGAQSFKTLAQENVRVEANTVRRIDAQLETSGVAETVTVTASAATLQADRADVNLTQTTREINDLPLTGTTGRNYQSLLELVPGAVSAGEQNSAAGNPQRSISFNVNGVSRLQNNTKLDGSSIVYPWLPTNTAYVPPAEAIQAVNIVTNSFDAEQGLAGGAAINVILKSGTNEYHGTGWGYDTNSDLRARNFFQTSPQNPKNILAQYGANFGGPILKNKLFFFADWERSTQRNSSPIKFTSLATEALRNGDFSGTGVTIYDPASNPDPSKRTPFPGDKIPTQRFDLAAVEMIKLMPMPNLPGFVNNFTASGTGSFTRDNLDFKVNYNHSEKLTLFGRYSLSPTLIFDPSSLGAAGGDALNGGQLGNAPGRIQVAGGGVTYTLSPTLVFDANVGYTRQRLGAQNTDIGTNFGLDVLKIPGTNGPDPLQGGIPSFQINNWSNMGNPNTGNPFLFRDNQAVASASLSWQKGAHGFRFGGDYQNQQLNHFQPQGGTFQTARGTFVFNGTSTELQNGAAPADARFNSWADFLLGLPSAAGKVEQLRNPNSVRMKAYSLYARDHWQISSKVTLTYGLRWERYPWPTRDHGGVSRFDPATGDVFTGGLSGVPIDTGTSVGPGQFLPRVGIAYRFDEKTVLRAGYGLSSDPKPYIDFRNAFPINFAFALPPAQFNGQDNAFLPVTTLRQGLPPSVGQPPDLTQGILKLPPNTGTTTFPKDSMRKYIHSFNFTVEHELTRTLTAQIGYVGTRSIGQQGFVNINASAPGTGTAGRPLNVLGINTDINMIEPAGDASYDSLQAQLNGRIGRSQFGAAYTFSKAIDYQDNDGNPRIQFLPDKQRNKGLAGYDRTQNLQLYGTVDLPFGKGQRWATGGVASRILGGWQLNGIMSATSGLPIYIVQGNGGSLNAAGSGQVPDQILSQVNIPGGVGSKTPYFQVSAYAPVNITSGQQRFGNAGRDNIRGPGYFDLDLSLYRTLTLTERFRLQFRADALNALNHPNFANPGNDISNAGTFGIISSTTGVGERDFRFGVRLSF
ncbi:MAG TPA: TonB-dependent receptor [Blastocatellia bacterium]|nr:TonB-dependent receptor [Blastocatellia bacterium]